MNTADQTAIANASKSDAAPSNNIFVTLDEPIQMGGQLVTQVSVHKPPISALIANNISGSALLNNADFATMVKVVPLCTSPMITKLHIENELISLSDLLQIHGEICTFFLTKSARASLPPRS